MSVAETLLPSVRGRERLAVAAALLASSVLTGTLVGFAFGAVLAPIDVPARPITIGLIALAIAADAVWLLTKRARPLSIGKQVPREWSSIFSPTTTASLYGARLGVGPLTMLNTWLWWAMAISAALAGVWPSVIVGATFGAARQIVTLSVSIWAEGPSHQRRFGHLGRVGRPSWLLMVAGVFVGGLALAACTNQSEEAEPDTAVLATAGNPQSADSPQSSDTESPDKERTVVTEPEATRITGANADTTSVATVNPSATSSTAEPTSSSTGADERDENDSASAPGDDLGRRLLETVVGFEAIDDPAIDRPLDIDEAANIQPDPTEELPLLETRGFRQGWTRAFRNNTRDVVVTTVYEFSDSTAAAFYLEDGLITIGGYGGQFFDVPDIPGGRGFRQEFTDGDDSVVSIGVTFTSENRWYLVYLVGHPDSAKPEIVLDAALAQSQRAATAN